MNVVAGLTLLLVKVHLSLSCEGEGSVLICQEIPSDFSPGFSSLVMILSNVGEISSSALRSSNLASVTRLRIQNAGVTGIAEGAFGSFQSLMDVSLHHNFLTEINPKWFGRPSIVSELNLTENQIRVLNESMLNGLFNLTKLRLTRNKIRAIDPGTFNSQTILAELDLSENRMSRVSPQVFRPLRSTRISLHGNPWDCSCGAQDFIDFLKDLHSRSLLDRPMEVTCESPSSLRGLPVLNLSLCLTSPPPRSPDVLTTVPASSCTSAQRTSRTSVQPKSTDVLTMASTSPLKTASFVTSLPSVTEISLHPKPSDLPLSTSTPTAETDICGTLRPSSGSNIVCTLVVVIVVLSLLLFVVCFLVALYRRKRSNKTVMPGGPKENELKDDSNRSSHDHRSEDSEKGENTESICWDLGIGQRRSFAGVRAKSADAILFTSPFSAPAKDQMTLQAEVVTQSNKTEKDAVGEQNMGGGVDGGTETESPRNATDVNGKQAADGRNSDKDPLCVSVNTDTVPYLSIGTNQNRPNPDDFNKDAAGRRSHTRKAMGRISTWPPTAVQWQARCKIKEGEKNEGSDVFTAWTFKFPDELKNVLNKGEHPSNSDQDNKKEDETEKNQTEKCLKINHLNLGWSQPSKTNDKTTLLSEAPTEMQLDSGDKSQDQERQKIRESQSLRQDKHGQKTHVKPAAKSSSRTGNKGEQRNEPKRAVTSRQRAENRASGSRAPSGGTSPDDETLLSGNEYAFMDLLHEVAQNNGRWTRERWRQIHSNKQQHQQRREDRGTQGV